MILAMSEAMHQLLRPWQFGLAVEYAVLVLASNESSEVVGSSLPSAFSINRKAMLSLMTFDNGSNTFVKQRQRQQSQGLLSVGNEHFHLKTSSAIVERKDINF